MGKTDKEIEKEEKAAAAERKRKSLSLPKPSKKLALSPTSRFNTTTDAEVQEASKGYVPANTAKSTGWAVNTYTIWARQRNARDGDKENAYPVALLEKEYPPAIVCSSLQRFILEARRSDGTKYPSKTLYAILCGLLRHSREVQVDPEIERTVVLRSFLRCSFPEATARWNWSNQKVCPGYQSG